jgi:anion-transporting  ArsA/GET3 family ATPase
MDPMRSVRYSHGAGRFLPANYDPSMAAGEGKQARSSPDAARVCICVGAGGVGKTTITAALAVALAARGERVAVATIDPAPRLAGALGLRELDADPTQIDLSELGAEGAPGELWALRVDPKRTLDELITRLSSDARARKEIFENPIYRELSSAVAGAQELSAMAKLYELREEGDFDVIVLDTPPAENAVDFLLAPRRLLGFLRGRALTMFLTPGGLAARMFGRPTRLAFAIFARVSGVNLLNDLTAFFRSLAGVIDGFGERATAVAALLADSQTTYIVVTTPQEEPAREALALVQELSAGGMRAGAVVFNRVQDGGEWSGSEQQARAALERHLDERLAARAASNLADLAVLARRDHATVERVRAQAGGIDAVLVPNLNEDVRDLVTLARIGSRLLGAGFWNGDRPRQRR